MKPRPASDALHLQHICDCMDRINEFTGSERAVFDSSRMVQDAVLRNMQTLAESTQRLSAEIKKTEPRIAWHEISAFRNVLTHLYLRVDLNVVWSVIEFDFPLLSTAVNRMLERVQKQDG